MSSLSSSEIRKTFLDFFASKGHHIVPSAPLVLKNDPTLMFTNAGMNQFKDIFLGNAPAKYKRVADTQKCLRVSGKHNDLEEVGVDTYHHTMFEMLGNWSFGDYFKKEAIEWAWELLTEVYKIPKDRLYVTVFEGDKNDKLPFDEEAFKCWKQWIAEDRILKGNKKDNFWEMGDTGPCGPCSEIHVDLRSEDERKKTGGKSLVNTGHPLVIEIWNNVFMEFNRLADGRLNPLPAKHVDTGMGFERLCMVLQGKTSTYDTDVFKPLIHFIEHHCEFAYGKTPFSLGEGQGVRRDIAMRVMADHIRAISFAIADGQLPSNNKAGYVIRRILRRAVRYSFSFLDFKEPFFNKLVPVLADQMKNIFPELKTQQDFVQRVIQEEEASFLRTLETGIKRFEAVKGKAIDGAFAFELYDTYGFPIDLTQLMAREKEMSVDMEGFNKCMEEQKTRSRKATALTTDDWISVRGEDKTEFVGYEILECEAEIIKYRKVSSKGKDQFQVVLNKTPFYAESGGQVGDTGWLISNPDGSGGKEKIKITDTKKENDLIIHFAEKIPSDPSASFIACVDAERRTKITGNHSATHLMHAALRKVLGTHVTQKGSLVDEHHTRFDFSHFSKVTDEELSKIEDIVNEKIRQNILLEEERNVPVNDALARGAMALFGEKYGDFVRVITFDKNFSVELCGGTHVSATGEIGLFKFIGESSVAAGVRRVEAITGEKALQYMRERLQTLERVNSLLQNAKDPVKALEALIEDSDEKTKKLEQFSQQQAQEIKKQLLNKIEKVNGINLIAEKVELPSADLVKNISFEIKNQVDNLFLFLAAEIEGKPHLSLIISDNLVNEKQLDASSIIREAAKEIQGGGGGQKFYATAGGKNIQGLEKAIAKAKELKLS